jgi:NAD+ kinase
MEKVAVVGKDTSLLEIELAKAGFALDKQAPAIVISYGGDGSALVAESLYPGVPRLTLMHKKESSVCEKCDVKTPSMTDLGTIIRRLSKGEYTIVSEPKVEAFVEGEKGKSLVGLNEVNVAHALPIQAMRFDLHVNGKPKEKCLIGDGVIVATPYGSSGYFKTITGRRFSKGLGIALNNVGEGSGWKYRLLSETDEVRVKVIRGPALLCADNNSNMIPLKEGHVVVIRKSKHAAKLIRLQGCEGKTEV